MGIKEFFNERAVKRLFWDEVFFWMGGTFLSMLLARIFTSISIGIFLGFAITGAISIIKSKFSIGKANM